MRNHSSQKGFTILETMVAITILVTAMVPPMTIAARGLQSAFYAKEHLTAVYLAQEAMEIVRMHRDNYALANMGFPTDDWYSNYFGVGRPGRPCTVIATGCDVDARDFPTFVDCQGTACRLRYDAGALATGAVKRGMYTHKLMGVDSLFTRVVKVAPSATSNGTNEISVTVEVSWQASVFSARKTVKLQSTFFNHYNAY